MKCRHCRWWITETGNCRCTIQGRSRFVDGSLASYLYWFTVGVLVGVVLAVFL